MTDEAPKNEVIEITEEEQAQFDKSVETCSTKEGRVNLAIKVFDHFVEENGFDILTTTESVKLVAHPTIGKIEVTDEEMLETIKQIEKEIEEINPEKWEIMSRGRGNIEDTEVCDSEDDAGTEGDSVS